MFSSKIFIVLLISTLTSSAELYNEFYRPQLHYSPPKGWMNDPNGLIFYNNVYHMFYQNNPNSTVWGPMHWGHAVSRDLVHWKTLPIALYPQGNEFGDEYIFSGSTLIDYDNVTGFEPPFTQNKTIIAIFTAHSVPEAVEKQWMAYSIDEGINWKYYKNNPIIRNPNETNFRDPYVFKYEDYFVAVLVVTDHIQIYNSYDLKHWKLVSKWGSDQGSHQGVWECPSLFPIKVTLNSTETDTEKWVLLISTGNSTGVSTGPNMQYFIGSFNGKKFINENPNDTVLWVDYGPDSYAGATYNLLPNKSRIFQSWMNRWDYAESLSFNVWNGQMALPRILKLINNSQNKLFLSSLPVPQFESLRIAAMSDKNIELNSSQKLNLFNSDENVLSLLDIELTVDTNDHQMNDTFGIEFSGNNDKLLVYFNGSFVIDRTNAGRHDFSKYYGLVYKAPRLTDCPLMNLRLILDRSSVELFADNGLTSMTCIFLSKELQTSKVTLFYKSMNESSKLSLIDLNVRRLKSIWK